MFLEPVLADPELVNALVSTIRCQRASAYDNWYLLASVRVKDREQRVITYDVWVMFGRIKH